MIKIISSEKILHIRKLLQLILVMKALNIGKEIRFRDGTSLLEGGEGNML